VTKQKVVRAHFKGFAELAERMGVNLFVAIGADALDGVAAQAGLADEILNAPLTAEALELNVPAVVRKHLDFDLRLDGTGHWMRGATHTIMHTQTSPCEMPVTV